MFCHGSRLCLDLLSATLRASDVTVVLRVVHITASISLLLINPVWLIPIILLNVSLLVFILRVFIG